MPSLRRLSTGAATLALTLGAGCYELTAPEFGPDEAARAAAQEFRRTADSLFRAGADPAVFLGYWGLDRFVTTVGRTTPVTLSIDGVPAEFLATAQQYTLTLTGCPAGALCAALPPLRTVVAWQRSDPRRVVQLTSTTDDAALGSPMGGSVMFRFLRGATLTYFDGAGGVYVGTGGTTSTRLVSASDERCFPVPPAYPLGVNPPDVFWWPCNKADFTAAFDGMVEPPATGGPRGNRAAGTHALSMLAQPVSGGQLLFSRPYCFDCPLHGYPDFALPPLDLRPPLMLNATLTAIVTDVVALTFTVRNDGTIPTTIEFPSGQQYDVVVTRPGTGEIVWQWSAGRMFAQMLGTRSLAPGEQLVVTERWTPTVKGRLHAQANLSSSTHSAFAAAVFDVP